MRTILAAIAALLVAVAASALDLTGPGGSDLSTPVSVKAESLTNTDPDTVEARGSVLAEWGGRTLSSALLRYNRVTQVLEAVGNVRIEEPKNHLQLTCTRLKVNLSDQTIEAEDAELYMSDTGYRVKAAKMSREAENLFKAEGAVFTACDGSWPSWRITAKSLEVEIEGYLFGKQGTMYFESLPTAWLPAFVFPALLKRQSGFLPPKIGNSSKDGFILDNRFYWVVNESVDAIIEADYRAARGLAEQVEVRYVTPGEHYGEATVRHYTEKSGASGAVDFKLDHKGSLWRDTALDVQIDYTGDKETRIDYAQDLARRNLGKVDSHASLTHFTGPGAAYLMGRYTQAFAEPQEDVVQLLPGAGFLGADYNLWGPFFARSDAKAERLWRERGQWADRITLAQGAIVDANLLGVGLDFGGGYRWNLYSMHEREEAEKATLQRGAAWGEASAWAGFEGPLFGYLNIIEPRLNLRLDERGRGDGVPLFDDSDIFSRRRVMKASVETRLHDPESGENLFLLDVSRTLDFTDGGRDGQKWLPWSGKLGFYPAKRVSFYADGDFDPELEGGSWLRWGAEGAAGDERGDRISIGEQYVRGKARYLEVRALAQLMGGWALGYQNRYSLADDRLLEDEIRFFYRHQCWQASASYSRSYVADRDLFDRVFMFTISLAGLGKVGSYEW